MATSPVTRILFVPYRPPDAPRTPKRDGGVSQQKHAAREYHRKAKKRRLSAKKALENSPQSQCDDLTDHSSTLSPDARPLLPRTESAHTLPDTTALLLNTPGSTKSDPFDALSVPNLPPYVQEMLEYSLTYQWPIYKYCNPEHRIQDMKRYVLDRAMRSPTSFYAIVFAAATHNAMKYYGSDIPPENVMLRLSYKKRFIEQISHEIQSKGSRVSNEVLYTMLSVAAYGSSEELAPLNSKAAQSVLASAHQCELYARLPCEWAHLRALCYLVNERGGLLAMERKGFAIAVSIYDVFTSFQRLVRPAFPLLESTEDIVASWHSAVDEAASLQSRTLGMGFKALCDREAFHSIMPIIGHITTITVGYDQYQRGDPNAPTLRQILSARYAVQHDILCLYDRSSNTLSIYDCLYEVYRLAISCFMLIVLFPVPRPHSPHDQLASRLMVALNNCDMFDLWEQYPGLLSWATILGGIVARGGPLRLWFTDQSRKSPIRHSVGAWPLVRGLLSTFLWLESDCDAEGLAFWCEACENSSPLLRTL